MNAVYWTYAILSGICFGVYWSIDVSDSKKDRSMISGVVFGTYMSCVSMLLDASDFILLHAFLSAGITAIPIIFIRRSPRFDRFLRRSFPSSAARLRAWFRIDEAVLHDIVHAAKAITARRSDDDFRPIQYLTRRIELTDAPALIARRQQLIAERGTECDPGIRACIETAIANLDAAIFGLRLVVQILGSPFIIDKWYSHAEGIEHARVGLELSIEIATDTLRVTQVLVPNNR